MQFAKGHQSCWWQCMCAGLQPATAKGVQPPLWHAHNTQLDSPWDRRCLVGGWPLCAGVSGVKHQSQQAQRGRLPPQPALRLIQHLANLLWAAFNVCEHHTPGPAWHTQGVVCLTLGGVLVMRRAGEAAGSECHHCTGCGGARETETRAVAAVRSSSNTRKVVYATLTKFGDDDTVVSTVQCA